MSLHIGTLLLRCDRTRTIRPGPRSVKTRRLQLLPIRVGWPTRSSTHQLNQGDLGGHPPPPRRPPTAPPPPPVQPHPAHPADARPERLEQRPPQVVRATEPPALR